MAVLLTMQLSNGTDVRPRTMDAHNQRALEERIDSRAAEQCAAIQTVSATLEEMRKQSGQHVTYSSQQPLSSSLQASPQKAVQQRIPFAATASSLPQEQQQSQRLLQLFKKHDLQRSVLSEQLRVQEQQLLMQIQQLRMQQQKKLQQQQSQEVEQEVNQQQHIPPANPAVSPQQQQRQLQLRSLLSPQQQCNSIPRPVNSQRPLIMQSLTLCRPLAPCGSYAANRNSLVSLQGQQELRAPWERFMVPVGSSHAARASEASAAAAAAAAAAATEAAAAAAAPPSMAPAFGRPIASANKYASVQKVRILMSIRV